MNCIHIIKAITSQNTTIKWVYRVALLRQFPLCIVILCHLVENSSTKHIWHLKSDALLEIVCYHSNADTCFNLLTLSIFQMGLRAQFSNYYMSCLNTTVGEYTILIMNPENKANIICK